MLLKKGMPLPTLEAKNIKNTRRNIGIATKILPMPKDKGSTVELRRQKKARIAKAYTLSII